MGYRGTCSVGGVLHILAENAITPAEHGDETWEPLGITARRRRRRRVRGTFAPPPPALMGWGRNGWVGQHRRARGVEEEEDDDDEVGEHGLERWVASRMNSLLT